MLYIIQFTNKTYIKPVKFREPGNSISLTTIINGISLVLHGQMPNRETMMGVHLCWNYIKDNDCVDLKQDL